MPGENARSPAVLIYSFAPVKVKGSLICRGNPSIRDKPLPISEMKGGRLITKLYRENVILKNITQIVIFFANTRYDTSRAS